ncbi:hypothetical protein BDR22DRAFT_827210 [Usnea florida]
MATGNDIQTFSKRKADTVDIDGGEDSISRLKKKARLREELDFLQIRLRPKTAFRRPPSPPSIQQSEDSQVSSADLRLEKKLHSSQSQAGDDRDNPLVLEDDDGQDQSSGSEVDHTSSKKGQDQCASILKGGQGQRALVSHWEEREIEKIVGMRRTRRGYEYKVRWSDTWLLRSDLGKAQGLVQQFDKECLSFSKDKRRK